VRIGVAPWRIGRRAPLIGEHNRELYQDELGYAPEQLVMLKASGVI
jgi:crotonobetainyl-CoA:carnitine CoA-transferase CaiB-like acyl-CoA transferase